MIFVTVIGINFSVNAASLCGSGMKFVFSGGGIGNVTLYIGGNPALSGSYLKDRKDNIRIQWNTGAKAELIYEEDGVYSYGDKTLRECD